MIDPINLILGKHLENLRIQCLGRCQIVTERFFDNHPPPVMVQLAGKPDAAELLDYRAEEAVGNGEIEQCIGHILLPLSILEKSQQTIEGFQLGEISSQVRHSTS